MTQNTKPVIIGRNSLRTQTDCATITGHPYVVAALGLSKGRTRAFLHDILWKLGQEGNPEEIVFPMTSNDEAGNRVEFRVHVSPSLFTILRKEAPAKFLRSSASLASQSVSTVAAVQASGAGVSVHIPNASAATLEAIANAIEGRRDDDPFLDPGEDPNPEPIKEPEPPTAPKAFMILLVRPRRGAPVFEVIWTVGGALVEEDVEVPKDVPSGYVVCEDASVQVVAEERDEGRGIVRRAYGIVGDWRPARSDDFESRKGRRFWAGLPEIPPTLRDVFSKGQADGRRRVAENVRHALGAFMWEG